MEPGGERVRVEEVTAVTYGGDRETFFPWPVSSGAVWVGTHHRTRRDRAAAGGW